MALLLKKQDRPALMFGKAKVQGRGEGVLGLIFGARLKILGRGEGRAFNVFGEAEKNNDCVYS